MKRLTDKGKIEVEILRYVPDQYEDLVTLAFRYGEIIHNGHNRLSGEPFIIHNLNTAYNCAKLKLDTDSIIASILHQCIDDELLNNDELNKVREDIQEKFGGNVLELIEQVESINKATKVNKEINIPVLTRFLLGSSNDIRPLIIKICDVLDDIRTIEYLPSNKLKSFCHKALDIYSPIAEYLNLSEVKKQIDELAFKHLNPEMDQTIENILLENGVNDKLKDNYIEYLQILVDILGYKPKIIGRVKSKYSIFNKLSKYLKEGKGSKLETIKDVIAFSIITQSESDCFEIVQAIKNLTHEVPELFDDYISNPKANGYKALQLTTVIPEISTLPIEVQVLTYEMYQYNTYGPASHIAYKASKSRFANKSDSMDWVESIHNSISNHINLRENRRSITIDGSIFNNRVFVFTPKGLLIELEKGSSIIDFAYRVHTNLGHSMIAAKVNGKPAPLTHQPQTGDTIEIVSDKKKDTPNNEWLKHIKSVSTRQKITKRLKERTYIDRK